MWTFAGVAVAGWLGMVLLFRLLDQRRVANVLTVVLGLQTLLAIGVFRVLGPAVLVAWLGQLWVWAWLLRAWTSRMPSRLFAGVVGVPAQAWIATTFLALPWSVTGVTWGAWVPFVLGAFGVMRSLTTRQETVVLDLDAPIPAELTRFPALVKRRRGLRPGEGLRVAHLSDPHLGSFMSVARLRRICERVLAAEPDIIALTGDFYTFESNRSPEALAEALAPLRAHPHVYACRGNHDLEVPAAVATALSSAGVKLLIDDAVTIDTRRGRVQLVGFDFRWSDRARHFKRVLVELVRPPDAVRIGLLHDPGAFRHLPPGSFDLVLSGHTHGGHVGLVSLGLDWTAVGAVARMPDHGPWGGAGNRLYVSRTLGHYGFQLRLGVPAEESILELTRA